MIESRMIIIDNVCLVRLINYHGFHRINFICSYILKKPLIGLTFSSFTSWEGVWEKQNEAGEKLYCSVVHCMGGPSHGRYILTLRKIQHPPILAHKWRGSWKQVWRHRRDSNAVIDSCHFCLNIGLRWESQGPHQVLILRSLLLEELQGKGVYPGQNYTRRKSLPQCMVYLFITPWIFTGITE